MMTYIGKVFMAGTLAVVASSCISETREQKGLNPIVGRDLSEFRVVNRDNNPLAGGPRAIGMRISTTSRALGELSNLKRLAATLSPGRWMEISAENCAIHRVVCSGPFYLSDIFLSEYPPGVWGNTGPRSIITAWGSGVWDGARMYLSNGGHTDYRGNDVLAYDAATLGFVRLTEPSPIVSDSSPAGCRPESGPPSAHTYDGAVWVPSLGEAWFAGAFANCGDIENFWAFNPRTLQWRETRVPEIGWGGTALHPRGMVLAATGPSSCYTRFRIIDPANETQTEIDAGAVTGCQDVAEVSDNVFRVMATYGDPAGLSLVATPITDAGVDISRQVVSEPLGVRINGTGMAAAPDGGVMLWAGDRNTVLAKIENGRIVLRHFANVEGPAPATTEGKSVFGRWVYVLEADIYLGLNHTNQGV